MATPKVDFVTLADNVAVASGATTTSPDRITMSPGRTSVTIRAHGATAAGVAVSGGLIIVESLEQSPGAALAAGSWRVIGTMIVPPDLGMIEATFAINSLNNSGLFDVGLGTTIRCQMRATGADAVSFTIVAIAGGP